MGETLKSAFVRWPHCAATYAALALLLALLFFRQEPPLNPIETHAVDDPFAAAAAHAGRVGGRVYTVSFTGSMKPLLQGGEKIVAVGEFPAVKRGDVLIYEGALNPYGPTTTIVHRAVQKDAGGWIMSGDNNAHTETWSRVTAQNYRGTVVAIYKKL